MRHAKRPWCRAALGALTVVALGVLGGNASRAVASDGIARPPGAVDNRGYELVSQADKNANQIHTGGVLVASDGEKVLYQVLGGTPGSPSGRAWNMATRTGAGWASRSILPSYAEAYGTFYQSILSAPDLSVILAQANDGLTGQDSSTASLVQLDGEGGQKLIHTFLPSDIPGDIAVAASDDFRRLYAQTFERIDASHQPDTQNIYDFGQSPPKLVSTMVGRSEAPLCGVLDPGSTSGFADGNSSVVRHWTSTDGRRVFFLSRGDDCSGRINLYMRDVEAGETRLISGPPVADIDRGVNAFLGATPDGSYAFYLSPTTLDSRDADDTRNNDRDVYRYDVVADVNTCITCVAPNAVVATGQDRATPSEDGSHVYFDSTRQLLPEAVSGAHNVYVVAAGELRLAGIAGSDVRLSSDPTRGGYVSEDGRFLLFHSSRSEMNVLSGSDNGGFTQIYLYDDEARRVVCISCPVGRPASANVPVVELAYANQKLRPKLYPMTADGKSVFFTSAEALVAADVNGGPDIYQWKDGQHWLITNGVTNYPGQVVPQIYTATPDGKNVFFLDIAALTPDVQDSATKVFNARVNGGFTFRAPIPECVAEECQGLPSSPPGLVTPASNTLAGAGNLVPETGVVFRVGKVTRAMRAKLARRGSAALVVRVSEPGRISVVGQATIGKRVRRVLSASKRVNAGRARVVLRLSRAGYRHLKRTGRLRVVLGVRYSEAQSAKRLVLNLTTTGPRRGR